MFLPQQYSAHRSGAALATVVGVLIEVPVMLFVVKVANRTQGWYSLQANK
jgi:ACR3 family arsenite efflux pump ArsB